MHNKKRIRRSLAVAASACMLSLTIVGTGAVPVTTVVEASSALTKTTKDGFVIKDGVLTAYKGKGGNITIPSGVTKIGGRAFQGKKTITSVTIPATVIVIGNDAFRGCTKLKSVKFSKGLTGIEYRAFYNCTSLTSIKFPKGLKSVARNAFEGCGKLEKITIPASLTDFSVEQFTGTNIAFVVDTGSTAFSCADGILYNKEKTKLLFCPTEKTGTVKVPSGVTTIDYYAFYKSKITKIELPDSVTTIKKGAFRDSKLKSITMSKKLTKIGGHAFYNTRISKIVVPEGVTRLVGKAFADNPNLKTVSLPSALKELDVNVFDGCNNMTKVTIPEKNPAYSVDNGILYEHYKGKVILVRNLTNRSASITIPEGVETICNFAFYDNETLTEINIPDSVNAIYESAFRYCENLQYAKLPASLTKLGPSAFSKTAVKSVTIPSGVKIIEREAFIECTSLKEFIISEGVEQIWGNFYGCSALKSITIPASVTTIDGYYVNDEEPTKNLFGGCTSLTTLTVAKENPAYTSHDNMLFSKDKKTLYAVTPTCSGKITVPTGVERIYESAFSTCNKITEIVLPSSVEHIQDNAFGDCSKLKKVTFSSKVDTIPENVFTGSSKLKEIVVTGEAQMNALMDDYLKELVNGATVKATVTVGKGETLKGMFQYLMKDSKDTLSYTSKNKSIATVSSKGKITAKKTGTTTILVKTKKTKKTIALTVKVKAAPKSVCVADKSITLSEWEDYTLTPSVNKGAACKNFTYATSDDRVVHVWKTGEIRAKRSGTAVITVTAYNGKTAKIKVTVKKLSKQKKRCTYKMYSAFLLLNKIYILTAYLCSNSFCKRTRISSILPPSMVVSRNCSQASFA